MTNSYLNRVTVDSLKYHADKGNIPYLHEVLSRPKNGLTQPQTLSILQILDNIPKSIIPLAARKSLSDRISVELEGKGIAKLPSAVDNAEKFDPIFAYLDRKDTAALSSVCYEFHRRRHNLVFSQFAAKKHFTYEQLEDFRLRLHLQRITDLFAIDPEFSNKWEISLTFQDLRISDRECAELFSSCPAMTGIKFIDCPHITHDSLIALAKLCPKLKSISIENCKRLGNASVHFDLFSHLEHIAINGAACSKLGARYQELLKFAENPENKKMYMAFTAVLESKFQELSDYNRRKIYAKITAQLGRPLPSSILFGSNDSEVYKHPLLLCNHMEPVLPQETIPTILGIFLPEKEIRSIDWISQKLMQIDTQAKLYVAANMPSSSTHLDFSEYPDLTDQELIDVAANHVALTSIDLSGCAKLSNTSLIALAKKCPRLTDLNASRVVSLTSDAIKTLAECCRELRSVKLMGCDKLEPDSIDALATMCKDLSLLETSIWKKCETPTTLKFALSQCRKFGDSAVDPEFFTALARYRTECADSPKTDLGRYYHSLVKNADEKSISNLEEYFLTLPHLTPKQEQLFCGNKVQLCDAITPLIISGEFPPLPSDMSIDTTYGPSQFLEFSSDINEKQIIDALKEQSHKIKSLILDGYPLFSKDLIDAICENMLNLTHINLDDSGIQVNDILKLLKFLPNLRHISIQGDTVSNSAVKTLKSQFPSVEIVANEASENKEDD